MIGGESESNTSDKKDVYENGAFPKTRYHVEGKPNGISVLQARQSFLKKQFRTKGLISFKIKEHVFQSRKWYSTIILYNS